MVWAVRAQASVRRPTRTAGNAISTFETKPRERLSVEPVHRRPLSGSPALAADVRDGWGDGVGLIFRCSVKQVYEHTDGRGFARGFRPSVPNLDTGVSGVFKNLGLPKCPWSPFRES
jgi:hypothetical protein